VRETSVLKLLSVLHVFGPESCLQCLFDVYVVWKLTECCFGLDSGFAWVSRWGTCCSRPSEQPSLKRE